VFGCTIMRRDVENQMAQVTDGYMFVAFSKASDADGRLSGTVDHFGFTVDDLAATQSKADEAGLPVARQSTPQVPFHESMAGWSLEFRERGWDESIASHTELLELQLAQDQTPKTLHVAIPQSAAGGNAQSWHRVCGIDELPPGGAARVEVGGQAILVANVEGSYCAMQDQCTHMPQAGRLSEGKRTGCVVDCPVHLARFDMRTGEVLTGPARRPLRTYEVKVLASDVLVKSG
jgi:3-phenylpropionate/trans-cinnamate dioxygenase ferredoxin subunit